MEYTDDNKKILEYLLKELVDTRVAYEKMLSNESLYELREFTRGRIVELEVVIRDLFGIEIPTVLVGKE